MLYVDRPLWPGRGRYWSHLISDVSFAELHAFAELLGAPRRGFDRDHYDLPAEVYDRAIWLGAVPARSRELVERLKAAGLRTGSVRAPRDGSSPSRERERNA
jgi:hypothetical protein